MSGSAQLLRLHLLLESTALLRVFDRLGVLGLVPRAMEFRRDEDGQGRLSLDLDLLPAHQPENLMARLGQIEVVVSVERASEPITWSAAHGGSTAR